MRLRLAKERAKPAYDAGEVLKLSSGGHPMSATWRSPVLFAPGNWLIRQWFSDTGELQQEMFPAQTLQRASQDALAA
ncbi:DUF2158 domain-containing protein [Burkholderia sp. SG-MS1]|uniref:YodC family protein n=1 Tax=Paraburkholderia sp. SG-MS1 TaxID=2023741 RepID=UPI00144543EE|nr:YodC family protein [Paraburkholderia sp. SG-MS1]NKJ47603.1 DUF2158 domain-containing protein [Paraburkholderia sp. SG-MS1]